MTSSIQKGTACYQYPICLQMLKAWLKNTDTVKAIAHAVLSRHSRVSLEQKVKGTREAIRRHLQAHHDSSEGVVGHHFTQLSAWPSGLQVDPSTYRITPATERQFWNAGRQYFGEHTDATSKARSFDHFVHVLLTRQENRMVLYNDHGHSDDTVTALPCNTLRGHDTDIPLPQSSAVTTLRCIYQQWKALACWVDPDTFPLGVFPHTEVPRVR